MTRSSTQKEAMGKFDLDQIRVAKIPGGMISKSFVVDGMVVPRSTMGNEKKKLKVNSRQFFCVGVLS